MNPTANDIEILAVRSLMQRGLGRAPGPLAFTHNGQAVKVTIEESVYRGHYVTVFDGNRTPRQFRATAGGYDWNAIAAHIRDVADQRVAPMGERPAARPMHEQNRQLADELSTITGAADPSSRLSIKPSPTSPGRVRVRLDEVDLDPVSVIQLYAAVSRAFPEKPGGKK